jgi:hypothetical protein
MLTPCGSSKNRRFGGTWRLLHQGDKTGELGTTQAATSNRATRRNNPEYTILHSHRRENLNYNVVSSSPILVTVMMEALSSSETSVLTTATRRNIPEDVILHSHRRENLKFYILA